MGGFIALLYGVVCYLAFFLSFLYAIAFVEGLPVPKTLDSAPPGSFWPSFIIDVVVLSVFALQHSIMARPAFKRIWTRLVPPSVERSTYCLFAALALILIYWQWRTLPQTIWSVSNPIAANTLVALSWAGWVIVLISTFLISHLELFGLAQVYARFRGVSAPTSTELRTPAFYRVMRHPIYFGFIVAFWATPTMSAGHLLFAALTTSYVFVGIFLEERDLVSHFGDSYVAYRRRVRMILPLPRMGTRKQSS